MHCSYFDVIRCMPSYPVLIPEVIMIDPETFNCSVQYCCNTDFRVLPSLRHDILIKLPQASYCHSWLGPLHMWMRYMTTSCVMALGRLVSIQLAGLPAVVLAIGAALVACPAVEVNLVAL